MSPGLLAILGLTFYSPGSNSVASIVTTPARKTESQEKDRLVFNHYRGEYFLAEVLYAKGR